MKIQSLAPISLIEVYGKIGETLSGWYRTMIVYGKFLCSITIVIRAFKNYNAVNITVAFYNHPTKTICFV